MYLFRVHTPALRKEVEETIRRSNDANLKFRVYGTGGKVGKDFNREIVEKYVQEAASIPVLRSVIDTLDNTHEIVYADLRDLQLTWNPARDKVLDRIFIGRSEDSVRLSEIDAYVSVTGTFRRASADNETTIFHATYGTADDVGTPPSASMSCMHHNGTPLRRF